MKPALAGLRVWCTRPGRPGERSCWRLHQLGAEVRHAPTLRIEAVGPETEVAATISGRAGEIVVGLTSPTSTENFVAACGAARPDGAAWPVVAVGKRTALRARELGLDVLDTAPRATAVDLAPVLARASAAALVLLPGSNLRRGELAAALRSAGREVLELQVQQTLPLEGLPEAVADALDQVDLVVAYSPSALGFVETLEGAALEALRRIPVAVMGPTTGERARSLGLDVVVEPPDPDEDQLFGMICRWYQRD